MCIANKYAAMSMKIVMAHLVKNFVFSTNLKFEEIELDVPMVLRFRQGYKLSIKERL
jgi:hypothetical protein